MAGGQHAGLQIHPWTSSQRWWLPSRSPRLRCHLRRSRGLSQPLYATL